MTVLGALEGLRLVAFRVRLWALGMWGFKVKTWGCRTSGISSISEALGSEYALSLSLGE